MFSGVVDGIMEVVGAVRGMEIKLTNSTGVGIWACVDSEKAYVDKVIVKVNAALEGGGAKVSGGAEATVNISWTKINAGFTYISPYNWVNFDIPQSRAECYVTAYTETGKHYGGPKCYKSTYATYRPVIFCPDLSMRKGFKNKTFRVDEGSQHYYGKKVCEGCGSQRCKYPVVDGNDGWCKKAK